MRQHVLHSNAEVVLNNACNVQIPFNITPVILPAAIQRLFKIMLVMFTAAIQRLFKMTLLIFTAAILSYSK